MMWPWFNWGFGGFGWIMPIMMILFWGLIIWAVIALVRGVSGHGCYGSNTSESALEMLKRRYASGEITKEESRAILKQCHEKGLIHTIIKCREEFYAICNCCACCCVPLRMKRDYGIGKAVIRHKDIVAEFKARTAD